MDMPPARPADLLFPGRREAIRNERCSPKPIGCGGPAGLDQMTPLEKREYPISGLCVNCQRNFFGQED